MSLRKSAVLLFLAACSLVAEERALLIGIGKYRMPGHDLPGIDKDVRMKRDILLKFGFNPTQIREISDQGATNAAIRSSVGDWLVRGVRPDDRVVFYYSGHGSLVPGPDGRPIAALVPHDFDVRNRQPVNALTGPELGELLNAIPSRHVLVVVDACNSGRLTEKGLSPNVVPKFLNYPGMPEDDYSPLELTASKGVGGVNFAILSACRRDEFAGASDNGSLLTAAWENSVRQLMDLKQPVTLAAVHPSLRTLSPTQHPELSGSGPLQLFDWSKGITLVPDPVPANLRTGADWQFLRDLNDTSHGKLSIKLDSRTYAPRSTMTISIQVPEDGYINVISMGQGDANATVLFPNSRAQNNHFNPGTLTIPGAMAFNLRQNLPEGFQSQQNEVIVLFTKEELNLYRQGAGPDVFRAFDENSAKSTIVTPRLVYASGFASYTIGR